MSNINEIRTLAQLFMEEHGMKDLENEVYRFTDYIEEHEPDLIDDITTKQIEKVLQEEKQKKTILNKASEDGRIRISPPRKKKRKVAQGKKNANVAPLKSNIVGFPQESQEDHSESYSNDQKNSSDSNTIEPQAADSDLEIQDPTRAKITNIFNYLLSVYSMMREVVRNVDKYELQTYLNEFPETQGCAYKLRQGVLTIEIEKQDILPAPAPPNSLEPWIIGDWRKPLSALKTKDAIVVPKNDTPGDFKELKFHENAGLRGEWERWYFKVWKPWANDNAEKGIVQEIYRKMFLLTQRIERQLEEVELVWGHGMLYWKSGEAEVKHPVVTTQAQITFNEASGKVYIYAPDMAETKLEMEFIYSIKNSNMRDLAKLNEQFKKDPANPWDQNSFKAFCSRLINLLSSDGRVDFNLKNQTSSQEPLITYEPVLLLRKKRFGYRQDLEEIVRGLTGGQDIPDTIGSIINAESTSLNDESVTLTPEQIKFPLAANQEQLEIVNRLNRFTGVTVQGPPGTGKSHTIANLLSHMLAEGKKVLVLAKAERPLRVIRDMVPENIRPFCVTLFSDESSSINELEEAVKAISEISSNLDASKTEEELLTLDNKLKEIRKEIAETSNLLKRISKQEQEKYFLLGDEFTLSELGLWLNQNKKKHGWIRDKVPQNNNIPLTEKELHRFYELSGLIKHEDKAFIECNLPDINKFQTGEELNEIYTELSNLKKVLSDKNISVEAKTEVISEPDIADHKRLLVKCEQAYEETKKILNEEWLSYVLEDAKQQGERLEYWRHLTKFCKGKIKRLYELNNVTSGYEIVIPDDRHYNEQLVIVNEMTDHFKNKGQINLLQKMLNSRYKYILENCYVDGLRVKSHQDLYLIKSELNKRILKTKLIKRWDNDVVSIGGPTFKVDDVRLEANIDDKNQLIEKALELKTNIWDPLSKELRLYDYSVSPSFSLEELQVTIRKLKLRNIQNKYFRMLSKTQKLNNYLKEQSERNITGKSIWQDLRDSLSRKDWQKWDATLNEISRLSELHGQVVELKKLQTKLAEIAPHWASEVVSAGGKGKPLTIPGNIVEAWEWVKAETWLETLHKQDPISLSKKLDSLKNHEKKLTAENIAISTKLNLSHMVTEEQRRSLIAWQQSVKKIGKGKGKYAQRYKRDARQEMMKARSAVPVWIMPLSKIIDSFPAWGERFDLVIVDESSQLDIFGVLALFRAKKILVVGDDQQISPQDVGVDRSAIHKLMDDYLKNIEHGKLFEPRYSLYDLAKQVFPGVIMLKEHFRCLPEIIQFSNDNMYQGDILPLRQKDASLPETWEPIIHRKLENGYRNPGTKVNEPEADEIVEAIVNCCKDSAYDGMTMGIISLLGSDQGQYIEQKLFEVLKPEEIKQRKILCGDAYYFQGDERDVIFMSMVDAKGDGRLAVLSKSDDWKRFNVAASRAKNQAWLFHSLNLDDLNKNDVRYHLIRYFQNPHRLQKEYSNIEDLCESDFEKRVLKELLRLGYTVKPQEKVGHRRIDLVVLGMNDKLAVECDGDAFHGAEQWEEDWNRQVELENKGWKFFRIRGSAYYRDPGKTIQGLIAVLEDMGIYAYNH